jgi:hypothetical protein
LFFKGEDRTIDASYIREIFARFRRGLSPAVEPEEVNDWVEWALQAKKTELSGFDAVKEG